MQLENGETAENMNYVDASAIDLSDMGSMNGGEGGFAGIESGKITFGGETPVKGESSGDDDSAGVPADEQIENPGPASSDAGAEEISPGRQNRFGGERTEGYAPSDLKDDSSADAPEPAGNQKEPPSSDSTGTDGDDGNGMQAEGNMPMPGGDLSSDMNGASDSTSGADGWIWAAVSVLILGAGLIIVKMYKY